MDVEQMVTEILLELGVPDHLRGYPILVQAILLAVKDKAYIYNITAKLYPDLAKHFKISEARVERNMRHAIEAVWDRGGEDVIDRYFGGTIELNRGKATNRAFITRIANVVKQRMKLQQEGLT